MKLIIKGQLHNLNDYISAERRNRYAAAKTRHAILEAAAAAGVGEGPAFPAADHAAAPQWTPDVRAGA